jgi:hypothetical protein
VPAANSQASADAAFFSNTWTAWLSATQAVAGLDQTQVIQVGLAAQGIVGSLNSDQSGYTSTVAQAFASAAGAKVQAQYTFQLAQTQILGQDGLNQLAAGIAFYQAQSPSCFASVYASGYSPVSRKAAFSGRP